MPGAPYYAEAFSPLPGRCFRMVAHHGESRADALPRAGGWRGSWRAPNGRRYRVKACEGHRPPPVEGGSPDRLASPRVVAAGAEVQVHPAALPLDLIDLALAVVLAAGLEGEQLGVPRERLEGCQHVSYCHALSVALQALEVVFNRRADLRPQAPAGVELALSGTFTTVGSGHAGQYAVLRLARTEKGSGAMGRRQATFREGIGEEQRHNAQALRDVRSLRGETQQELGRLLGWSLSMVSRFEAALSGPIVRRIGGTVPSLRPRSCASSSPPPTKHCRR